MSTLHRSRPRILFISEAGIAGPQVRRVNMLRALEAIGDVEILILADVDGPEGNGDKTEANCTFQQRLMRNGRWTAKLRRVFDRRAAYPHGCGVNGKDFRRLLHNQKEFDLTWFFKLKSAEMFPVISWQRSVVDVDDLPSTFHRTAMKFGGPISRIGSLREHLIWRRREQLLGERFKVLAVCSDDDKEYLRRIGVNARIHVIPNGSQRPSEEPLRNPAAPPRIGFIGNFGWSPNLEGMRWFVSQCWPRIKHSMPESRLRIVGRHSDKHDDLNGPDVDRLGEVPDLAPEVSTWSAMIVPIRMGAGTRVKIADGFSMKCPTISTSLGAFGYNVQDGRELYLANSVDAFSEACLKVLREPEEATRMAERAWIAFLENWSWDVIREKVWAAAEDCLRAEP